MITAVVIQSSLPGNFYFASDGDTITIPIDPDSPEYTYFRSLNTPLRQIEILGIDQPINLFLLHSGISSKSFTNARKEYLQECDDPLEIIPVETWREDLPPPDYTRAFHVVDHLIVHHSAGSNTNTNYIQVVRDIYLFHTEVNGWSDIGYNYLISQDGTLFAGRDPGEGNPTLVRGAHFCGRNTGTLGICMLGNFESADPTDLALNTLTGTLVNLSLVLGIDPLSSSNHATGFLDHIAGHRDGCATLCPGENLYAIIGEIRNRVDLESIHCTSGPELAFRVDTSNLRVNESTILYNESRGYEDYVWLLDGGDVINESDSTVEIIYYSPGFYDVGLSGRYKGQIDSLLIDDYLEVRAIQDDPVVFPNPLRQFSEFKIDYDTMVVGYQLRQLNGSLILKTSDISVIQSVAVEPGIYLLELTTTSGRYVKKVILNP
jgi:hypothetical protein